MLVASLRAQLDPAHATGKNSAMLHFNLDRVVNKTRCQAAAWVPGTQGGAFVAAHFDGQFYIYHKACRMFTSVVGSRENALGFSYATLRPHQEQVPLKVTTPIAAQTGMLR